MDMEAAFEKMKAEFTKTISQEDREFVKMVRDVVRTIDQLGPDQIHNHVEVVRDALRKRGLEANCHVNQGTPMTGTQTVEWYAGQLLDIVETKSWFAMNSFINCLDLYCRPEWSA